MDFKELRKAAGLEASEVAKLLNIGRSTLYRIENSKTKRLDHHLVERMKDLYQKRIEQREAQEQPA